MGTYQKLPLYVVLLKQEFQGSPHLIDGKARPEADLVILNL